jgi:hypothetical protein
MKANICLMTTIIATMSFQMALNRQVALGLLMTVQRYIVPFPHCVVNLAHIQTYVWVKLS